MAIGTRGCATGDSGEEDRSCNLGWRDEWAILGDMGGRERREGGSVESAGGGDPEGPKGGARSCCGR